MKRNYLKSTLLSLFVICTLVFSTLGASPPNGNGFNTPFAAVDETVATLATLDSSLNRQPNVVVLGYSEGKRVYNYSSAFILASVTVTTPSADTEAAANWNVSDVVTSTTAHGFTNGLKGQVTTSSALPTGISGSTDYFVRVLSTTTFSLYDTYAHAIDTANTTGKVNITVIGTGNHTFTPTAIAGGTISLQGSIDGTTWADITSSSSNVTATAKFYWNISDTFYPMVRVKFVNTAGVFTSDTKIAAKF
jgi:hypothetical protein